jgi:ATP/ADP translocase
MVNGRLGGWAAVPTDERRSVGAASLLLFLLLSGLMVLQPAREALGLMRGIEGVRRLFLVTVGSTLLLAPLFGWLAARVPRPRLLAVSFRLCALILLGVVSTFLYFSGLRVVAAHSDSPVQQTALFAHINLWMQLATLAAQAFLATRIMRVAGVGCALAVLPVLAVSGFAVLALAPTLAVFTLVNAVFRAAQQGIAGPAQETLFTVLDRQDKYKAKSFLDTFGVRAGDASGAFVDHGLAALGSSLWPLSVTVLGLSVIWLAVVRLLARAQLRIGKVSQGESRGAQAPR